MRKRMLAMFLSIVMLLSSVPLPAFAADVETLPAETEITETFVEETTVSETEDTVPETEAAQETEAAEPVETESPETEPAETVPAETEPAETEPQETEPAERVKREDRVPQERNRSRWEVRQKTVTKTETVRNVVHEEDGHFYYVDETVESEKTYLDLQKTEHSAGIFAIREQESGSIFFETFEDLKELAGRSYDEWTYAFYEGEGPLVIAEDLQMPENLEICFYTDNSHLIISEGVTFATGSGIGVYVDVLEINGIYKNRSWTFVYKELTVNGTLMLYNSIGISSDTVVNNHGSIISNDEYSVVECRWYVELEEELHDAVEAARTDENGFLHYIIVRVGEGFTLSRNLTVPANAELNIQETSTEGDYAFTIPQGVTLTLNGEYSQMEEDVVVSGTLENNSRFFVDDYTHSVLTFTDTGVYKGKGELFISTEDTELDWTDLIVGLNTSNIEVDYEQYEGWRYWSIRDITGLTKLGKPTDLTWNKKAMYDWSSGMQVFTELVDKYGSVAWKPAEPDQAWVNITYYDEDGTYVHRMYWSFSGMTLPEWRSADDFGRTDPESGTYYFTVQSMADGEGGEYCNSDVATSGLLTYTKPNRALGNVPNIRWEWPTAKWDHAAGQQDGSEYEVEWFFAPTRNEEPRYIGGSWGMHWSDGGWKLWDEALQENGVGYYYFRVRALSDDITQICNGQWSELSEPYYLTEVVQDVENQLGNISPDLPEEEIRDLVQDLDTEALKDAMLIDNGTEGIMDTLEELEEAVGGAAGVHVSEEVGAFDADKITIVGANLNDAAEGSEDPITLVLDKPKEEHVLDALYDDAVAVSFSMTLENVEDAENLEVPVKITLPIPDGINPDFLVILHYKQNGEIEEISRPWLYVFRENGQLYTSFVLTSFSDFAITHYAEQEADGGSENGIRWSVTSWGNLVISGQGDMEDYGTPDQAPWYGSRDLIQSVTIEEGVGTVGTNAFRGYENLQEVSLPASVGRVEPSAFAGCHALRDIFAADGNEAYTSVDGVLFNSSLTCLEVYPAGKTDDSYEVPAGAERIGDLAFCENRRLKAVVLPESLTQIGEYAFAETAIREIWFGGNAPQIADTAFSGMTVTIYYPANDATWTDDMMGDYGGNVIWSRSVYIAITGDSSVVAGGSVKLTAKILPAGASGGKITWELADGSDDFATLKVSGNTATIETEEITELRTVTVIASAGPEVAPGVFYLTVRPETMRLCIGQMTADGELDLQPSGVILLDEDLEKGFDIRLGVVAEPVGADDAVTWTSSDTDVASIAADGTAHFTGEAGIVKFTAAATDGSKVKSGITYTVLEKMVAGAVGDTNISLLGGKSVKLKVINTLTGKEFKSKDLRWTIVPEDAEADAYATINSSGKLTAKKVLKETKLSVYGEVYSGDVFLDGVVYEVTIYPATTHVKLAMDGETIRQSAVRFDRGRQQEMRLTAKLYPEDAQGVDVTWSVSDKKGAYGTYEVTGNELVIRSTAGQKTGSVTIKATANDGSKKSASVKVEFGIFADVVEIGRKGVAEPLPETASTVLRAGEKLDLWAKVYAENGDSLTEAVTKPGVVWSLEDPADKSYLSVSGKGSLKAGKVYTNRDVTVLATSKDGEAVARTVITVIPGDDALITIWTVDENLQPLQNVTKETCIVDLNGAARTVTLQAAALDGTVVDDVQWSPAKSSKNANVTVNADGTLTLKMLSAGSVKVKAKSGKQSATVTVKAAYQAKDIVITHKDTGAAEDLQVASGKSIELQAAMGNATNKKVTWSIAPEDAPYAKISSSGKLTAAKDQTERRTVTVIATAQDGSKKQGVLDVTVVPLALGVQMYSEDNRGMTFFRIDDTKKVRSNTTFEWDMAELDETGRAKDLIDLAAIVYPYYGDDDTRNAMQNVRWETSSKSVATFVEGEDGSVQLKCLKPGTVTVTAKALDGSKAKVSVKIKIVARIRSLSLKADAPVNEYGALEVRGGKKLDLSKLIATDPVEPTNEKLTWKIVGGDGAAFAALSTSGKLSTKKVTGAKTVCVEGKATDGSDARIWVNVMILPK